MRRISTNPVLFRIKDINHDLIDSTHSPAMVLGNAFHNAMEVYYGGSEEHIISNESEAIKLGLEVGLDFIEKYPDGFIGWNSTYQNKQQVMDKFTFAFNAYVKEMPYRTDNITMIEKGLCEKVDVEWRGEQLSLPVPLKGYPDKVIEDDGYLDIVDYKTSTSFPGDDDIDGKKILQAVVYYFLVYAYTGRKPRRCIFEVVKVTKNKDGGPQVKQYFFDYEENDLFFDFFFRFYYDMIRAINGEMVWLPNIEAMFDNEIAMVAYINRLDVPEEVAAQMKAEQVTDITELLKRKIANTSNMNRMMKTVETKFVSGKTLNYKDMNIQDRIKTKMAEHGMLLEFDGVVEGAAVDLYRYTPSIGLKMSRIASYVADVEQVLGVTGVRILTPIPGTTFVGFEVPRSERTWNGAAPKSKALVIPIGTNTYGQVEYINLVDAPHVLVAGTTGGGKSVLVRSILNSLGSTAELWLADPKGVELNDMKSKRYAEDPEDIRAMLESLVIEMDRRYAEMKKTPGLRRYDKKPIVCVVDEFGDFMLANTDGKKKENYDGWTGMRLAKECTKRKLSVEWVSMSRINKQSAIMALEQYDEENRSEYADLSGEDLVVKLAQKARAAAIHLVIATQSPRADIVTGRIKANFPTRIALRTASEIESRIILDAPGAEKLLGKGDALILRSDSPELVRVQSFNV